MQGQDQAVLVFLSKVTPVCALVWDVQALADIRQQINKPHYVDTLLIRLRADFTQSYRGLRGALLDNNEDLARTIVHKLKSSAGFCGAHALYQLLETLEGEVVLCESRQGVLSALLLIYARSIRALRPLKRRYADLFE